MLRRHDIVLSTAKFRNKFRILSKRRADQIAHRCEYTTGIKGGKVEKIANLVKMMKIEKLISSTMTNPYKRRNRRQIDRILITFQSHRCFLLFHCVHFPFHSPPFRLFYAPPSPRIPLDKINSFIDCETNFSFLSFSIYLSPLVPDKNIFHSRDTREGTIEEGAENCERGMDLVNLRVGRLAGKRI